MFAEELTLLRQGRCLSQEELALATGVSVRTISNLERGTTRPRRGTVRALAHGLGLSDGDRERFERAAGDATTESGGRLRAGTLPAPVASIVGREAEVAELSRLLLAGDRRLVVVTGPGGVGKSRLALEVAWRVAGQFARVDAVDVSTLRDRDEVLVALASAVGVPATGPATVASVAARVGDMPWLIVADSLEHVVDVTQDLTRLVARCPYLRILATSRIRTDDAWPLAPLPVPTSPAQAGNPAVRLLTERIRAGRPAFAVTADNADAVASLCRRLDGLPLALEIAAGHLRTHDIAEIEGELATLPADVVDIPGRHRTLRATVQWSTDRLDAEDRARFAVLGAFRGPVPRDAWAAVVAGAGLPVDRLDATLARLDEVSLVGVVDRDGATTVTMLDTIREVAEDLLRDAGLDRRGRTAHARHLLDLVRTADLAVIDSHVDNVRAAVAFATAHDAALLDAGVVAALADYLRQRGRFPEAHRTLAGIAAATGDPATRSVALLQAGIAANLSGDPRAALDLAARSTEAGDGHRIAVLNLVGSAHKALGELDAAQRAYGRCLDAAIAAGDTRFVTVALNNLGTVAHDRGAYDEARDHYGRSLAIKREAGDERGMATALLNLGGLHNDLGQPEPAREHLVAAIRLTRRLDDPYSTAFALTLLAGAEVGRRRFAAARRAAEEALAIADRIDSPRVRALAEMALGDLARAETAGAERAGAEPAGAERAGADPAGAAERYAAALAHATEPFERARILERLAATTVDDAAAAARLAEAEEIRRSRQYAIPPVDRPLAERTRHRLGPNTRATAEESQSRLGASR